MRLQMRDINLSGNDIVYTHTQDVSNKSVKVDAIKGEDLEGYINVPTAQAQSYVNAHAGYKLRPTGDGLATVYKPLAGVVFELYETNNGVKVGSAIPINGNTDIVSDASGKLNLNYPFDQDKEYSIFEKTALSGYERMLSQKTFRIATEATRPGFDGTISIYMNNKKYVGSILVVQSLDCILDMVQLQRIPRDISRKWNREQMVLLSLAIYHLVIILCERLPHRQVIGSL